MNSSSLFVPSYGPKKGEDGATAAASVAGKEASRARRRVLPSTTAVPQAKRSLLPSMVFNGKIEYIQVQSSITASTSINLHAVVLSSK